MKANVLLFDNKAASKEPLAKELWIYDLRTNQYFTLKTKPMRYADLEDFIECYHPENRHQRTETDRFRKFSYDEIITRDKTSLDIFWLKDDSLKDLDNLTDPDTLALEIVENLEAGLESFRTVAESLSVSKE